MIKSLNTLTPEINEHTFIAENAVVIGDVHIGEGSSVWYGSVLRGDVAPIRVGKKTNIQDLCIFHSDHGLILEIGDAVTIGHSCIIHGTKILGHSIIGMGSILLNGSVIEKNTILGAGSLVTEGKVVKEGELWMGRPAKFIRNLTPEEVLKIEASAENYYQNGLTHKGENND
ncbi:gamma carbonic anhydrase family protein [Proteiniclasticum ruminis]|uniref:Carbonic anhydrase or acetyltransferase, isoleucine patch superfamily n=1 Tax=Proteiniclasticum ruminis TaxID=398199 RepID=A0A1I4XX71_9CLOT|nr:gamma carbonic anhydrase family protein [Proteiniclasticum ruminis]SFN30424.1 Carbonic anhydrase or acetyltransferase, isoleucine patch superfamily [Proteiniclasticum ruminis]